MPVSLPEVQTLKQELEIEYRERHEAFRKLRQWWHGHYWKDTEFAAYGIQSIFRDLTAKRSDVGPDVKLVHNVLQEVCVKYQTFLSPLPMIRVYVDPPESEQRRAQATLKERALYGLWSEGKMSQVVNQVAWYLPLMGDCFLGIWPDFERKIVRPLLRSPEHAFPVRGLENDGPDALIFARKFPESAIRRAYPNYTPQADQNRGRFRPRGRRAGPSEPMVERLEYSDDKEFALWVGEQKLRGVQHDLGFNLFEQLAFITVPGEPWNHGAVEQAVNLVEMGNALYSLMFEAMIANVFPTLFLINASKAPEQLDLGRGGVVPLNEGGDAKWLSPPTQVLGANMSMLQENERAIKQATAMPDVNFGQFNASIVTGKAINELQGAGTGSTVEMVQGVGMGSGMVAWNEKALYMLQTMFRDDDIVLYTADKSGAYTLSPRMHGLKFKGSKIVGSCRNEVVFSPHMDDHDKLVMGLQALGAGLVSKKYVREQIGIPDSEAMSEEIIGEAVEDGIVGAMMMELQSEPTPEHGAAIEERANAYLEGEAAKLPPEAMAGAAPPAALLPPGAAPPPQAGPAPPSPGPAAATPAAPSAPEAAGPPLPEVPGGPPGAAAGPSTPGSVTLDELVSAFQGLQGLQGRVFLVGEVVQQGETQDDVEVALTNPDDRQTISAALPKYHFVFHVVTAEPTEPHVEVTPGSEPQAREGNTVLPPELAPA